MDRRQKDPHEFHCGLFQKTCGDRPVLNGLRFNRILREKQEWLERPFSTEEVTIALHNLNKDKALGSDGFPSTFYLDVCEVIETDIMQLWGNFMKTLHGATT